MQDMRGNAARKADRLRLMVSHNGPCSELAHLNCPLPLDPGVHVAGIVPSECSVFKSALAPLLISLRTSSPLGNT